MVTTYMEKVRVFPEPDLSDECKIGQGRFGTGRYFKIFSKTPFLGPTWFFYKMVEVHNNLKLRNLEVIFFSIFLMNLGIQKLKTFIIVKKN